jgi:hypothetical protein
MKRLVLAEPERTYLAAEALAGKRPPVGSRDADLLVAPAAVIALAADLAGHRSGRRFLRAERAQHPIATSTAVPAGEVFQRPCTLRFPQDETRDYLVGEQIAAALEAGRSVTQALQADLPLAEGSVELAAGLLPGADRLLEELSATGGAYALLLCCRLVPHARVSRKAVGALARAVFGRRQAVIGPFPMGWTGGDWVVSCLQALGPDYGDLIVPLLRKQDAAEHLGIVARWWPDQAIAALVQIGAQPYPGLRRVVVKALAVAAAHHPMAAVDGMLRVAASGDGWLRREAALHLAQLDLPAMDAAIAQRAGGWVETLLGFLPDETWGLETAVTAALARLGMRYPKAVPVQAVALLIGEHGDRMRTWGNPYRPLGETAVAALELLTEPASAVTERPGWAVVFAALAEEARSRATAGLRTPQPRFDPEHVPWDVYEQQQRRYWAARAAVEEDALAALRRREAKAATDPIAMRCWLWEIVHDVLLRALRETSPLESTKEEQAGAQRSPCVRHSLPETIAILSGSTKVRVDAIVASAEAGYPLARDALDAAKVLAEEYPLDALPLLARHAAADDEYDGRPFETALLNLANTCPRELSLLLRTGVSYAPGEQLLLLQRHPSPQVRRIVARAMGVLGVTRPRDAFAVLEELRRDEHPEVRSSANYQFDALVALHPGFVRLPREAVPVASSAIARRMLVEQHLPLPFAAFVGRVAHAAARFFDILLWTPKLSRLPRRPRRAVHLLLRLPRALVILAVAVLPFMLVMFVLWLVVLLGFGLVQLTVLLFGLASIGAAKLVHTVRRAVFRSRTSSR